MGPAGDRTHTDGSSLQQDPRLLGPPVVGPKAILGPSGGQGPTRMGLVGQDPT
jgi:hypothetical protein